MSFTNAKIYNSIAKKGKAYTHNSGQRFFNSDDLISHYLALSFDNAPLETENLDYFISILWSASNEEHLIDFFGYSDIKNNWKGNPDISSWVLKNRVWRKDNNITCGEGIILLGKEEEFRRKTKNIEEYMKTTLDLEKLNKLL